MDFDKILSIRGRSGLYQLLRKTKEYFVTKSLLDGKKITVKFGDNISILSEIAVYTLEEELPLRDIFYKIQEKEGGGKTSIGHKKEKVKLEEYFSEVLPNYDKDRVYASDIKKIIRWYNILHGKGITDFSEKKEEVISKTDTKG